jgi:hypothetical protein
MLTIAAAGDSMAYADSFSTRQCERPESARLTGHRAFLGENNAPPDEGSVGLWHHGRMNYVSSSKRFLSHQGWRQLRRVLPGGLWSFLYSVRERILSRRWIIDLTQVSFVPDSTPTEKEIELTEQFVKYWTEYGAVGKAHSGYGPHYSSVLADPPVGGFKDILEIGVLGGGSHRAWSKIVPKASVWGFDIDPATVFSETRIQTFVADQLSNSSLRAVKTNLPSSFDLVVDDGWHQPEAGIRSLQHFLPMLNPGGYYIVEDIDLRKYRRVWGNVQSELSHLFFTSLIEVQSDAALDAVGGNYGMFILRRRQAR